MPLAAATHTLAIQGHYNNYSNQTHSSAAACAAKAHHGGSSNADVHTRTPRSPPNAPPSTSPPTMSSENANCSPSPPVLSNGKPSNPTETPDKHKGTPHHATVTRRRLDGARQVDKTTPHTRQPVRVYGRPHAAATPSVPPCSRSRHTRTHKLYMLRRGSTRTRQAHSSPKPQAPDVHTDRPATPTRQQSAGDASCTHRRIGIHGQYVDVHRLFNLRQRLQQRLLSKLCKPQPRPARRDRNHVDMHLHLQPHPHTDSAGCSHCAARLAPMGAPLAHGVRNVFLGAPLAWM